MPDLPEPPSTLLAAWPHLVLTEALDLIEEAFEAENGGRAHLPARDVRLCERTRVCARAKRSQGSEGTRSFFFSRQALAG